MDGWIKLHRKIQDHWIYQEKRKFSRYEAWLDMIMMANHKGNRFLHGNELIDVERGQFVTSEIKLMDRWDWGKNKIRLFFDLLEKDGMITRKADRKRTTITICNYGLYHDSDTEDGPQADHRRTTDGPQADTNKNDKKEKNDKEDISNWIKTYQIKCKGIYELERAESYIGVLEMPLIELYMKKSEGKSVRYFETIANDSIQKGIRTLDDWKSKNEAKQPAQDRLDFLNDM
ncbi:hypothetical protein [Paenibacillus massiliensis]|uniref:hypothetical protein n=1 Tax=Paenibacillus massiliensis TaxID=225917 RepID=UPI0003FD178C|nr:hypothetical protein [Paenibacillus massiliensis]